MRSAANSFLVAVQFMTRLPVPRGIPYSPDALARSAVFFPAIGLLVGAGGAALYLLLSPLVARDVVVVLILVYLVTVTGGLHEDALGDAADGLGGGWEKDRVLAIMRDSRIGSFGTIAIAAISGFYYWRRIGGITGDCLGATNQLTEIAIYLMGAVLP